MQGIWYDFIFCVGKLASDSETPKKPKQHIPNIVNVNFDKQRLLNKINNKPAGSKVHVIF